MLIFQRRGDKWRGNDIMYSCYHMYNVSYTLTVCLLLCQIIFMSCIEYTFINYSTNSSKIIQINYIICDIIIQNIKRHK